MQNEVRSKVYEGKKEEKISEKEGEKGEEKKGN